MTHEKISYDELEKRNKTTELYFHVENMEKEYVALKNTSETEIEQLRKAVAELDEANLKILNLTRALEISKTKNSYLNNTISSLKGRFDTVENELQKNIQESFEDDQRISNIASENSTLREAIHKSQIESIELKRSVENVEVELKKKKLLLNELTIKDISFQQTLREVQEKFTALKEECKKVTDIETSMQELGKVIDLNESIERQCEMEDNEKFFLEKKVLSLKTTCENMVETAGAMLSPNFWCSVILNNWQKVKCGFTEELDRNNDMLVRLTEELQKKRKENQKIIIELNKFKRVKQKVESMRENCETERNEEKI